MRKNLSLATYLMSILVLTLFSCEKNSDFSGAQVKMRVNDVDMSAFVSQSGSELHADLFAGKDVKAGEVIVTRNGSLLTVKFVADDGWAMSETHLSVTKNLGEVPAGKGGNPATGLFKYSSIHDPAVTGYLYDVPSDNAEVLYVLAHAVVSPVLRWNTNLTAFDESLPETAVMKVDYPVAGSTSYFTTTVTSGILDGTFGGWCIDVDNVIYDNMEYPVKVISSYDPEFSNLGLVENPQNMDLVNWIINQDYPGKAAPDLSLYTYGDVQRAIWELIDDNYSESGLGQWSPDRVANILTEAANAGESFIPQCGENIAMIFKPVDVTSPFQITIAQAVLTGFPAACQPVCGNPETAWAAGYDFGSSNWAKYFTYFINK